MVFIEICKCNSIWKWGGGVRQFFVLGGLFKNAIFWYGVLENVIFWYVGLFVFGVCQKCHFCIAGLSTGVCIVSFHFWIGATLRYLAPMTTGMHILKIYLPLSDSGGDHSGITMFTPLGTPFFTFFDLNDTLEMPNSSKCEISWIVMLEDT